MLFDELARAGITPTGQHSLLVTLAYPLAKFAPHLAAAYLPEFLVIGDGWWGQGFSESEAGSDLAALRCRVRGGRATTGRSSPGMKIWTSHAETANRIFLAGTDGHAGRSFYTAACRCSSSMWTCPASPCARSG